MNAQKQVDLQINNNKIDDVSSNKGINVSNNKLMNVQNDNHIIMYCVQRRGSAILRIMLPQCQERLVSDLHIIDDRVNIEQILVRLRQAQVINSTMKVFYFDAILNTYCFCSDDFVPITNLIAENTIIFKVQQRVSDELLANPIVPLENYPKRSPQRQIAEVFKLVHQWRSLCRSSKSTKSLTMEQAAAKVGVPLKSLEDYYLLLRNGKMYEFKFCHPDAKIGVLRAFVRDIKTKIKNQLELTQDNKEVFDEIRFFNQLEAEIFKQGKSLNIDQFF